jgi:hypothetical protein
LSNRRYVLVVLAGVLLAFANAWWGRGTFAHALLVAAVVLLGAVVAALGAAAQGLAMVFRQQSRKWVKAAIHGAFGLALVALLQVVGLPLGRWLHARDVAAARQFCDELITTLDRERSQRGSYPSDPLTTVPRDAPLPHLLRGERFYVTDGAAFILSFEERDATVPHVNLYSSQSRAWSRF